MEQSFWILELREKVNKNLDLIKEYKHFDMRLYLFGSAVRINFPNDLDIVILYHRFQMIEAQNIRNLTVTLLRSVFSGPIDVMLLSYEEESDLHFVTKEKAKLICPIRIRT